jgi:hypothetical protein
MCAYFGGELGVVRLGHDVKVVMQANSDLLTFAAGGAVDDAGWNPVRIHLTNPARNFLGRGAFLLANNLKQEERFRPEQSDDKSAERDTELAPGESRKHSY